MTSHDDRAPAAPPQLITEADAGYAYELVKTICTAVGPGVPASAQERARALIIKDELESLLGAGNVAVEEFTLAPGAFLGVMSLGALLTLSAALFNLSTGRFAGVSPWLTTIAALAFVIVSLVVFILEFVLYREFVDPFFPQKTSLNVIGTLRPPGTAIAKRLLIVSGHHDSAPENLWLRFLGHGFYLAAATTALGSIAMLALTLIQLAGVIAGDAEAVRLGTLGWPLLLYPIVPSILLGLFFTRRGKNGGTVPGAADNLSACALAVALCRALVRDPSYLPADTEIRFVSFGSEEAGLRGSRRYVARHLDELTRLDSRLLNIETVAHPEIAVLSSDLNGTVKHSPAMVNSVVAAAERAAVPYRVKTAALGVVTDAAPFSQAGLRAAALLAFKMPQQWVAFYHQKWDRPDVLTGEPLLNVLKLALEWVQSGGE